MELKLIGKVKLILDLQSWDSGFTKREFVITTNEQYPQDVKLECIKDKTSLGNQISSIIKDGNLVSDNIVGNLIEKYVSDKIYKNRLIFDGYPRNLDQAANLDRLLKKFDQKIDIVLKLSVSLETVKKRIIERQSQENRADDNADIAIKRYQTYEKSSEPILHYYKQSKLLKVVNGEATISEINSEISDLIDTIKG